MIALWVHHSWSLVHIPVGMLLNPSQITLAKSKRQMNHFENKPSAHCRYLDNTVDFGLANFGEKSGCKSDSIWFWFGGVTSAGQLKNCGNREFSAIPTPMTYLPYLHRWPTSHTYTDDLPPIPTPMIQLALQEYRLVANSVSFHFWI